ncbi:MAG: alpha/beta fold hydrolase [Candidatus Marinimicrobia bacterium]|nr:alpha/beta fold hydrolase [Candidatus Neomarinimicrobiota bacterium]MCF7840513.1 alpha/beta fold hydrolase [Candidatus Neomarinimicrobiota bacterium]MCF7902241.1 alpha/beta fold hydrolase [Candidatus Neomarinimicrobiota bacterium]
MSFRSLIQIFLLTVLISTNFVLATSKPDYLILLHGLGRSETSMLLLEYNLRKDDYEILNIDYPGRSISIDEIAAGLEDSLRILCPDTTRKMHFITHSMGGIVLRYYLAEHDIPNLGRVVMLAPPNEGSQIVDEVGDWWLFEVLMGPAGEELGTSSLSVPKQLPPVDYPVGIIAGNVSIAPHFSAILPGPDDGAVSVSHTQVAGMTDFLVVPYPHTLMVSIPKIAEEAAYFLENGRFDHSRWNQSDSLDRAPVHSEEDP